MKVYKAPVRTEPQEPNNTCLGCDRFGVDDNDEWYCEYDEVTIIETTANNMKFCNKCIKCLISNIQKL